MAEGPESVKPLRGRSEEGQRGVSRPPGDSDVRGVRGATRRQQKRPEERRVRKSRPDSHEGKVSGRDRQAALSSRVGRWGGTHRSGGNAPAQE